MMMIPITGGSGSGKSTHTEQTVLDQGATREYYTATTRSWDEGCKRRITHRHQVWVDKGFETIECHRDLSHTTVEPENVILLKCMSNLSAGEHYRGDASPLEMEMHIVVGIRHLQRQAKALIMVTSKVFQDGIEYDEETRRYQQTLGHIDQKLAKLVDEVTEVVFGVPVTAKKREETL